MWPMMRTSLLILLTTLKFSFPAPSQAHMSEMKIHPPMAKSLSTIHYAQPWGFLVKGITTICAQTLTPNHLWICEAFSFIAINIFFEPTQYVISIKELGICCCSKKDHVIQAVMNTLKSAPD